MNAAKEPELTFLPGANALAAEYRSDWTQRYRVTDWDSTRVKYKDKIRPVLVLDDRWELTLTTAVCRRLAQRVEFSHPAQLIGQPITLCLEKWRKSKSPYRFSFAPTD